MQLAKNACSLVVLAAVVSLSGCRTESGAPVVHGAVFGDGKPDGTTVLARVDGYEITERMLDLRLSELVAAEQARYAGQDGRRLYLRRMVEEVLRVRDAERKKLDHSAVLTQLMISTRRQALDQAQRADLIKDRQPGIEEIKAYFARHRDRYIRLGEVHASHVECLTREDAEAAYRMITEDKVPLHTVATQHSQNERTKKDGGVIGHFNRTSQVSGIRDPQGFTEKVWDCQLGVNPPFRHLDRWHVVVIHQRSDDRPQTLEEAYQRVVNDMQTDFRKDIVEGWLRTAQATADIQYFGEYRPGKGKSPQELMERAVHVADIQVKIDLLTMLAEDYPESELADKALFLIANLMLDELNDYRQAGIVLRRLMERYPKSELFESAKYIDENMYRPGFIRPSSIEELPKKQ